MCAYSLVGVVGKQAGRQVGRQVGIFHANIIVACICMSCMLRVFYLHINYSQSFPRNLVGMGSVSGTILGATLYYKIYAYVSC